MGRFRGIVPNNDPERLARIMNEKKRMFGVDKAALDQQVQERKSREAQESSDLRAFAQKAAQLDGMLCTKHQANEAHRRALNQGIDAFRSGQADERSRREAEQWRLEQAANAAEQANNMSSPWLNEDPRLEQSVVSPYRVRRDHWKGMSDSQLQSIRDTQSMQVTEKAQQAQQERQQQQAYDGMQDKFTNARIRQAAGVESARRHEAARLAEELQQQVLEKQARDAALNKLYTNPPTSGYFAQFGTSHR